MASFDLLQNVFVNPEFLLRKPRSRASSSRHTLVVDKPVIPTQSSSTPMAVNALCEFSAPSAGNVPVGPNGHSRWCGVWAQEQHYQANEDASTHLLQFLDLCNTFTIKQVTQDGIRLCMFPFSLLRRVKQLFYATPGTTIDTWQKCSVA